MWSGWNSLFSPQNDEVQKVWYLPQINESPTSNAVVVETLNRSLAIAAETSKETIAVTYDLAIAKMAMKIQSEEKPKFDKVFIALGSFHVEMALLSAYGKFVAESGGPFILNECDVLAKGSLRSFHSGKNYKRCKRMHELLAAAMQCLHFKSFLSSKENSEEICETLRLELDNLHASGDITMYSFPKEIEDVIEQYEAFCKQTMQGSLGKTAQYWMQYIDMIHLYHNFSRSIRSGDLDLYTSCLPEVASYFFALNHQNYSRWSIKYHDNLIKLEETHPEVYDEFKAGRFGIKRTSKGFSKSPIDLTLEQTINKDAARQGGGISAMTNSISARQRWAHSHFIRTSIISNILEESGMTRKEDVSHHLKPHRIKSDNTAINKITS